MTTHNMSLTDVHSTFNNDTLECPKYSKTQEESIPLFTFWIDGVVVGVMAVTGLIANIVSALILGK